MAQNIFCIDGRYFDIRIPEGGIKRSFSVVDSDKSRRNIPGEMLRDIVGTYYNYTIEFDTSALSKAEYDEFYERISEPIPCHTIIVPYGQSTLEYKAYCTNGNDTLKRVTKSGNEWKGLSINFIAMSPNKKPG